MNKSIKTFFFIAILILHINFLYAQSTISNSSSKGKIVKWESLGGKDKELILYMPESYKTLTDSDYYTGGGGSGRVSKKVIISRYINGVVLLMEYYEGDSKQIQKNLQESEKSKIDKNEEIYGFELTQFVSNGDGYFRKTQYLRIKNRLYVLKAFAKSATDEIAKDFFNSVKLVEDKKSILPNVPKDVTSITLTNILEQDSTGIDDKVIESKEAARKVIVLYTPRPQLKNLRDFATGKVKLKVLFSSNGKIAGVEIVSSPSREASNASIEAVNKIIFIPAEKEGKLVSVYKIIEYVFERG